MLSTDGGGFVEDRDERFLYHQVATTATVKDPNAQVRAARLSLSSGESASPAECFSTADLGQGVITRSQPLTTAAASDADGGGAHHCWARKEMDTVKEPNQPANATSAKHGNSVTSFCGENELSRVGKVYVWRMQGLGNVINTVDFWLYMKEKLIYVPVK